MTKVYDGAQIANLIAADMKKQGYKVTEVRGTCQPRITFTALVVPIDEQITFTEEYGE